MNEHHRLSALTGERNGKRWSDDDSSPAQSSSPKKLLESPAARPIPRSSSEGDHPVGLLVDALDNSSQRLPNLRNSTQSYPVNLRRGSGSRKGSGAGVRSMAASPASMQQMMEDRRQSNADGMRRRSLNLRHMGKGSEEILKELRDMHQLPREKEARDCAEIRAALERNPICAGLSTTELNDLVMTAEYFVFTQEESVCLQGDPATHLFLVREGDLSIIERGEMSGSIHAGHVFGELALIHDCHRTSSVVVASDRAGLWGLERMTFRNTLHQHSVRKTDENRRLMESVSVFELLTDPQKRAISEAMRPQIFKRGQMIVTQGEAGDCLYIVRSGSCSMTVNGEEVRRLSVGDYFGERSLLFMEVRSASVRALEDTECISIGQNDLQKNLKVSSLKELLARNIVNTGLSSSAVFSQFQAQQLKALGESAVLKEFPAASLIHGTGPSDPKALAGVKFFIVIDGFIEVSGGHISHPVQLARGGTFGDEYVLEPNRRMTHTVRCVGSGTVQLALLSPEALAGALGSESVDEIVEIQRKERVLQKIHIFRNLAHGQKTMLVKSFRVMSKMSSGEKVVTQGELGSAFFIIKEGEVKITIKDRLIRTLGKHDYFGERALLYDEPRTASVTVSRDGTTLWAVDKDIFLSIIHGPMLEYLEYRIRLQDTTLSIEDIVEERVIGKGTFGVVKLVTHIRTKTRYALKVLMRSKIKELRQEANILLEREILAENDHPFIVKCVKVFEEPDKICFLTELISGGELLDVIDELEILDIHQAHFYIGSMGLAIESLHERYIAYRDLKPENVLLDHRGYIKLIDFGCARKLQDGYAYTVVGTPHYMAPEVLLGKGYNVCADIWSLGVCCYEFLCGVLPFANDSDSEQVVFSEILSSPLMFPDALQDETAKGFLRRILNRDPKARVGGSVMGFQEIQEDPFFKDFDWDQLMGRELNAPFQPQGENYAADNGEIDDASNDDDGEASEAEDDPPSPEENSNARRPEKIIIPRKKSTGDSLVADSGDSKTCACFAWCK